MSENTNNILIELLEALASARDLVDVNIAAGVALQALTVETLTPEPASS